MFASVPEGTVSAPESASTSIPQQQSDQASEEDEDLNDDELKQPEEVKLKNKIKVKLIIAEVATSNARKTFRKLVSPFLSAFDLLPECK